MGLRVVVLGIPGVGKTTVVQGLISRFKGAELVNFGTVMLESALSLRWVKDRDQLRKLTVEKQKKLQTLAATKISKMRGKAVIVDTHLFIRTDEGFWPGLPFDVVRAMKPTHLVLVEASPAEILARRAADKSRARDSVSKERLAEELSMARGFLTVASTLSGAPMKIVSNDHGRQDEVSKNLAQMLQKASK